MITLVEIYVDGMLREVVPFMDAGKAEDFRRDILKDDALCGIDVAKIRTAATDDDAIEEFWDRRNAEV